MRFQNVPLKTLVVKIIITEIRKYESLLLSEPMACEFAIVSHQVVWCVLYYLGFAESWEGFNIILPHKGKHDKRQEVKPPSLKMTFQFEQAVRF